MTAATNKIDRNQHSTTTLKMALHFFEALKSQEGNMSGNGQETILDCVSRIATTEPDNPLHGDFTEKLFHMSTNCKFIQDGLQDVMDYLHRVSFQYKLRDEQTYDWFHNDPTVENMIGERYAD